MKKSTDDKPVILIIESDYRVSEALTEELEEDFNSQTFESLVEAHQAVEKSEFKQTPAAAVVEMKDNTKDELVRYTDFFDHLPQVPVYLTLNYDSDYQLLEQHVKAWAERIFFRPFEIDKLVNSIKALT